MANSQFSTWESSFLRGLLCSILISSFISLKRVCRESSLLMTACAAGRLFSYWLRESNMESCNEHEEECLMVSFRFGLMPLPLENSSQQSEVDLSCSGLQSCEVALVHCDLSKCRSLVLSRQPSRRLPPNPIFLLVATSQSCSGLFYLWAGLQQIVPACFIILLIKIITVGYHQKEKRKEGVAWPQKLLNCLFDSACSMHLITPVGLQVICRISSSSMRQTPKMRTPFKGSVEWQSEVNTQLLLPWKLSLLPITILFDPITVFPLPIMMLLYWMSCERTFCSRSTTFTTFWQMEQKTRPILNMQVTVGCTALQPENPLMLLKGKKAVLRMEPRKALRGGGRQFKFCSRAYFRSLMAASVSRSKMGSMFKPEKQLCPVTMATISRIISHLLTALFSIRIEYKQLPCNFDLTAELNRIIEISIKTTHNNIPSICLLIRQYQFGPCSFLCHMLVLHMKLNYYNLRGMTTWLGDKYEGEYKEGWYHGYGRLQLDNGVIYEGQFVKGQYHGEGKLIYPNGGYYKAQWVDGKMVSGEYIFNDNLNFEKDNWKHCINDDRRFYQEYLHGIKPSGATQQTREDKPHNIPTGTYDTGDGYYEPVKSIIYSYQGKIFRTPTEEEVKFIIEKCRYVPKAVDIDGSKDRVIKKVLEIEGKK